MERNAFEGRREQRREDSYRHGEEIFYHDDGAIIRVKVLENNSDFNGIKYNLQVKEIVSPHPFCEDPKVGSLFECDKLREAAHLSALWSLTESI